MKKPKILLYDIENTPNLGYTWGKYEQNVIQFHKEWELLCFAYKWLGEKEVHVDSREGEKSDKRLVKVLHRLYSEADIVVAHNGDAFDQRKVRARMIFHKLSPPRPLATVDTKKAAKTYFYFNSNSLNDLGEYLGLGRKVKTDFDLWLGCMRDDKASWKAMREYNKQDVVLLEKVYRRLRPYILSHPNVARLLNPSHTTYCPACGSREVQKRGLKATNREVKRQWQCQSPKCGAWYQTALGAA